MSEQQSGRHPLFWTPQRTQPFALGWADQSRDRGAVGPHAERTAGLVWANAPCQEADQTPCLTRGRQDVVFCPVYTGVSGQPALRPVFGVPGAQFPSAVTGPSRSAFVPMPRRVPHSARRTSHVAHRTVSDRAHHALPCPSEPPLGLAALETPSSSPPWASGLLDVPGAHDLTAIRLSLRTRPADRPLTRPLPRGWKGSREGPSCWSPSHF